MRTATINIDGTEYLLCFSARVMKDCADRHGEFGKIDEALAAGTQSEALDETLWLLSRLMDAGARYAKHNGLENPTPLSQDELYDLCHVSDVGTLRGKIAEAIRGGQKTNVEVEPAKNVETTQGQ